jgi:hypothetical protein
MSIVSTPDLLVRSLQNSNLDYNQIKLLIDKMTHTQLSYQDQHGQTALILLRHV